MFGLVTGVYQTYFGSPELHILLVGAEESGKTALLERLKVTQFSKHAPPTPQTPQRTTTTTTPKSTSRTINRTLVSEFQSSSTTATTPVTTPVTTPATTTKMSSNHHAATTNGTSTSISTSNGATPTTTTNKFLSLACPAPSRYANAKEQQEDDDDEDEEEHENTPINTPIHINNQLIRQKLAWLHEKQTSSLESVLNGDETNFVQDNHPRTPFSSPTQQTPTFMENSNSNNPNNAPQYHLKTGRKMLPLEKIRPTSGQNLAKLDICGAKCVILDVSGKFQDLWERYYADADAVIFCWRLDHPPQHALLEKVRHKISDDVPFLIFGHEFDLTTATKQSSQLPQHESNFTSTFSSPTTLPTEWFLPHYHSNLMMAFCGSAHNGAGVRDAVEWLIPLAKRQAKLRVTIPVPEDM